MNRCLTLAAGMAASLTAFVTPALALPPIMEKVPSGAAIVVLIPSMEGLEKDLGGLAELAGAPAGALSIGDMLSGLNLEGLNTKGAFALVLPEMPDMEGGAEPVMLAIAQAADYKALAKGLSAQSEDGVEKAVIDGQDVFMKDLGSGFLVAGPSKDAVVKFQVKEGALAAHKAFYGSRADALSDRADVTILMDMAKLKPSIDQGLDMAEQQMADMAAMTGQDGAEAPLKWFREKIVADMRAGALALSVDSQGVGIDFAGAAKEGSDMAKAVTATGKAGDLLRRLPTGPYLLALAVDSSDKSLRDFLASAAPKEQNPAGALTSFMSASNQLGDDSKGMAMVMGVPTGGVMSGLLTRTSMFLATDKPEKYIELYKTELPRAMEKEKVGSMVYTVGAAEVDGVKIDSYEVTLSDEEGVPGMGQAMQFMFGPAGAPAAYLTPVKGGVVTTMSKSSTLMSAALKAANGENTLASDKALSAVGEKLPGGRTMEVYVGTKGLIDSLLPMAAMFTGTQVKVDVPENLPPVGMGISTGQGQMQASVYVPASVIKTGTAIAAAMQQAMPQEEPVAPADNEPKKTNPKF